MSTTFLHQTSTGFLTDRYVIYTTVRDRCQRQKN
jgi:hypothetical protein